MGIKQYKPTTPSLRWTALPDFKEITKSRPEKSLTEPLKRTGGRNSQGRITSRFRGGGHKRKYRIIDFKRDKVDMSAKVISIEYDPNRSSRIALLEYEDKERRYILWPAGLTVGDTLISSRNEIEIKPGNAMPLRNMPPGTPIHNLELVQGRGAKMVRSAGGYAQILAKEEPYAHIKLPSGEVRLIHLDCMATIGQIGNIEHDTVSIGKAGRSRWLGRMPRVRGVAMNPVDHPMGGGEGKSSGGRHPTSPWGQKSKGLKTRKTKLSDKYIIKRRKAKTVGV
ncbi:MAG: 50S ribosomal protein L2 [Candidatus Omnitrophica bacterium]|nr:50S ribosomal protein L2 [Candidatus Omnitrophota bacterium]MBU4589402.1 50S ribosomal protein L2 [Candidatus Omnitrophota bacterium]